MTVTSTRRTERVGTNGVFETPIVRNALTRLTAKERDVLALVAEGYSNERIARQLAVTARTVETHTSRIFAKLDLEADQATHRRVLAVLAYLNIHAPVSLWLETSTYGAASPPSRLQAPSPARKQRRWAPEARTATPREKSLYSPGG